MEAAIQEAEKMKEALREAECVGPIKLVAHPCGVRHWGVYHPDLGWWHDPNLTLWYTKSRKVAEVQANILRTKLGGWDSDRWTAKCFEEESDD